MPVKITGMLMLQKNAVFVISSQTFENHHIHNIMVCKIHYNLQPLTGKKYAEKELQKQFLKTQRDLLKWAKELLEWS